MKIILVPSSSELVGVAIHVYNLAKLLHENGMLDIVVCPADGWLPQRLEQSDLPFTVLPMSASGRKFVQASRLLMRFLQGRKEASVVHLHGRMPLFIAIRSLVAIRNLSFVATVHQFQKTPADGWFGWRRRLETFLLRHMRAICCVSEDLKVEVIQRIGRTWNSPHIEVIGNWIEPLWSRESRISARALRHRSGNQVKICAVGYLNQVKGFDVLIKAVALLHREGLRTQCEIFGAGPDRERLLSLAEELGARDLVLIRDPSSELRNLLPDYDAVVIPSRSESFSIVALEAYDALVPVIASDVSGLRQTISDGRTGLLFEPGNPQALAEKLKLLLSCPALAERLVANAHQRLQDYLPSDRLKRAYATFYLESLAPGK